MLLQILALRLGRGWRVLLAAGLWACSQVAMAQSGSGQLSGRISDHESRESLPGATVLLLETQQATQTDPSGSYQLSATPGLYHVQVRFVGYATETAEVRLEASGPAVVRNFQLHPDAVVLKGAEVRGHRADEPNAQATNSLSGAALRQTSGQALGEALQKISGVSAIQTGPSIFKPIIHGLHSNRISILNNGVRQEGQQWGQEHGPEIDPFVASRLTVVKGAASVRYGSDAIGGVVLVEPAVLPDSAGTTADIQLVGASNNGLGATSGQVQGNPARLPALRWRVQGTAKRAGTTRSPGYYQKNTGFSEYDYSAGLGWQKDRYGVELFYSHFGTKLGILSSAYTGSYQDLLAAIARDRPYETSGFSYDFGRPYQNIRHDLYKLTAFVKTPLGRLSATLASAHMAQLMVLGTNFVNFVGMNAWTGLEHGIEAGSIAAERLRWIDPRRRSGLAAALRHPDAAAVDVDGNRAGRTPCAAVRQNAPVLDRTIRIGQGIGRCVGLSKRCADHQRCGQTCQCHPDASRHDVSPC